jgi:hypothetical protein
MDIPPFDEIITQIDKIYIYRIEDIIEIIYNFFFILI